MTPQHRKRLSFAAVIALVVLTFLTAPTFAGEGVAVGLAVLALSSIAPAVVLGIIAYIWSVNDRESAKLAESKSSLR